VRRDTRDLRYLLAACLAVICGEASTVFAQEPPGPTTRPPASEESAKVSVGKFIAGAAIGLALHEAGHAAAGWRYGESRHHAIVLTSAGFWAQYATSEMVLGRHSRLRSERSPVRKGVLTFHLVTSAGYSVLAAARRGPPGRDTAELAQALRIDERWLSALVLMPALFDGIRYLHPDAQWARWLSRGVKLGSVALVLG
jgi:hypothetical protein